MLKDQVSRMLKEQVSRMLSGVAVHEIVSRLMAKFSEHYSPGIETGEGEGLSKMTEN